MSDKQEGRKLKHGHSRNSEEREGKLTRVVKGKRAELRVMADLLEMGLDVFVPFADIVGIDCIARTEKDGKPEYYEIQIKSVKAKYTALRGLKRVRESLRKRRDDNYFLIVYMVHDRRDEDELFFMTKAQVLDSLTVYPKGEVGLKVGGRKKRKQRFGNQTLL
ncbi:MAG: hypothetical protein ACE5QW_09795, partial [Thermoplasmata archaeon]